jgi:hypothetical protein
MTYDPFLVFFMMLALSIIAMYIEYGDSYYLFFIVYCLVLALLVGSMTRFDK